MSATLPEYRCWRCGGTLFTVSTNCKFEDGVAVGVSCSEPCAGMAFGKSLVEAFEMISRKPSAPADKPLT